MEDYNMAYKFQLGNAKLGGTLQQDGGLVSTDVDDSTAANIVTQIDDGEIAISKLAAKTISGKDLGTNLDNLQAGDGLSGGNYNGASGVTFAIDLKNNAGLEIDTGELAAKVDGNKAMEMSAQGLAVKLRADKGLGFHADGIEIQPELNKGIAVGANGIAVVIENNKGLEVGASGIAIDMKANSGLAFTGNEIGVALANNKGLEFDGAAIAMDIKANSGLSFDGNELRVELHSDALQFDGTAIDLKDTIAGNRTFSGNLIVSGDLTVNGTNTVLDTTTLSIEDKDIVLGSGNSTSEVVNGTGLILEGGSGDDLTFLWNTNKMELKKGASFADMQAASITATTFAGALNGNATTATSLLNARTIGGVSFNGTANIVPQSIDIADEENANADRLILFADGDGANQPKNDGDFHYNPSTGKVTATAFAGDGSQLTGVSATQMSVALKADTQVLNAGFNYIADMGSDGTDVVSLPQTPQVGDVVYVKAPSDCSGARILRIQKHPSSASHSIDGENSIDLVSPHAAVSIVYVVANTWKLF